MKRNEHKFSRFVLAVAAALLVGTTTLASADTLFTPTPGAMITPRYTHTATRLSNGKVLIAGGQAWDEFWNPITLRSTEIYDPSTGTFSSGPNLIARRFSHTATPLQDGRVLFIGGQITDGTVVDQAEVYDPNANGGHGGFASVGTVDRASG